MSRDEFIQAEGETTQPTPAIASPAPYAFAVAVAVALVWLCGEAGVGVRVLKGRVGGGGGGKRVPPAPSTDPLTW
jgi:hypothetical protein